MKTRLTHHIILATWLALSFLSPVHADDDALQNFRSSMNEIVAGFNSRDASSFVSALDIEMILDTALNNTLLDADFKRDFRKGFKQTGAQQLADEITAQLDSDGNVRLVRIKKTANGAQALIRLDFGESGYGYLDLHLAYNADKRLRIIDWFDYSTGLLYTDSLYRLVSLLSPTPTVMGKLFDFATDKEEKTQQALSLITMNQQGHHQQMVETFLNMDEEIRKNRVMNFLAVQSASQSGNDALYLQALRNMEHFYANQAELQLMLVDYHYLTEDFPKAIDSLRTVEKSFGVQDAAIQFMIANAQLSVGDLPASIRSARLAIELETDFENAYWSLLVAYVNSKDFPQAVLIAQALEEKFNYDMSTESLQQAGIYDSLIASKEYRHWQKLNPLDAVR